tara:strand:- start:252 stop:1133 length:882 start_codon:yes stop_codon:yes gene_type:complete
MVGKKIQKNKKIEPMQISKNFSIEVMPRTAEQISDFKSILPKGTYVYIAHLEGTQIEAMVKTANRLLESGFNVVPHFPARLIKNRATLEEWIKQYSDIGITKALILAGSSSKAIGDFESSMDLLATELYDKYKFNEIFCAGHPEGNKDIDMNGSDQNLMTALRWKNDFFQQTRTKWSLTTQFCFDVEPIRLWEKRLSEEGIIVPINIGVAGPAKLQTMIKYAILCGVGPSMKVLEKRAKDLTKLLLPYSPAKFLTELSQYKDENKKSNINSIHFFPLGGIQKTTEFLTEIKPS